MTALQDITTIDQYLSAYGSVLADSARSAFEPLHVPTQPIHHGTGDLLRSPFAPQSHVITAAVAALQRQKAVFLVAEMGTGKTLMGIGAVHCHADGQPYRAIVFCPSHLVGKWEREIRDTIPGALVTQIDSCSVAVRLYGELHDRHKPDCPEWYVISSNRAKLDCGWRPISQTGVGRSAFRMRELPVVHCPNCGELATAKDGTTPLSPDKLARHKCACKHCGQPLWTKRRQWDRFEISKYIHKRLKGVFGYLIVDEAHEEKSATSERANAMGSLAAAVDHVVALTGTLFGGYADHVRPIMFRLCPKSLLADGFDWKAGQAFTEKYGRLETVVKSKYYDDDCVAGRGKRGSSKTVSAKPGIMPSLFGRHLIGNTIFLGLEEVAAGLPSFEESVVPVPMDPALRASYGKLEDTLRKACADLLKRNDRRLLSTMLNALLAYPDHPYGWPLLGYRDRGDGAFRPIVTPADMGDDVRSKEQALIDLCLSERRAGRKVWVYSVYTQERNVSQRLVDVLQAAGLRVKELKSAVAPSEREAWIARHAPFQDIIVSHPQCVATGLDLFAKDGSYNFPTIAWYETGYNLFTLRQASRRSWRIGQRLPCKVVYFCYAQSVQEQALALMGTKLAASLAVDGKFSSEGLAALGEDDGMELALAKALINKVDDSAARAWTKVVSSAPPTAPCLFERIDSLRRKMGLGQPSTWDGTVPAQEFYASIASRLQRLRVVYAG